MVLKESLRGSLAVVWLRWDRHVPVEKYRKLSHGRSEEDTWLPANWRMKSEMPVEFVLHPFLIMNRDTILNFRLTRFVNDDDHHWHERMGLESMLRKLEVGRLLRGIPNLSPSLRFPWAISCFDRSQSILVNDDPCWSESNLVSNRSRWLRELSQASSYIRMVQNLLSIRLLYDRAPMLLKKIPSTWTRKTRSQKT